MARNLKIFVLTVIAMFALTGYTRTALAQEHPEHPKSKTETATFEAKDIGKAIQAYVDEDTALKGGYFLVFDAAASSVLQLKLTKIHQDKLAKVGEGLYFACSDFVAVKDATYDLDFFLREQGNHLEVKEIKIHKVNGKPRYNWQEKNGLWSTVDVK